MLNEHQPTATPVSNTGLYYFNSKIQDHRECIPKSLSVLTPPILLVPTVLAFPIPASPVKAFSAKAPLAETPLI